MTPSRPSDGTRPPHFPGPTERHWGAVLTLVGLLVVLSLVPGPALASLNALQPSPMRAPVSAYTFPNPERLPATASPPAVPWQGGVAYTLLPMSHAAVQQN